MQLSEESGQDCYEAPAKLKGMGGQREGTPLPSEALRRRVTRVTLEAGNGAKSIHREP